MRDYRKYDVWNDSHQLVLYIYKVVMISLPTYEQFDLTSQIKRAAYSIPMNIAEGCGRNSDKDFAHFLDIAMGSTNELEYCLYLAKDLGYISNENYTFSIDLVNRVKAKLINLIKSVRKSGVMR